MRRILTLIAVTLALLLFEARALSATSEVQIHLITMGPGDDLYTRGGHAAIMVARIEDGNTNRGGSALPLGAHRRANAPQRNAALETAR